MSSEIERELRWHARTPAEDEALRDAAGLAPHDEIDAPDHLVLQEPPLLGSDLAIGASVTGPVEGALASFVGPQLHHFELSSGDEPMPAAHRVRAFSIPSLVGRVIVASSLTRLPFAIRGFLKERLGPLPFRLSGSGGFGGAGKYFHVHSSVIAPPDGTLPMAIELYGTIAQAGPHDFATEDGVRFIHRRRDEAHRSRAELDIRGADLPGPVFILVRAATYASICYPGAGVPFYM